MQQIGYSDIYAVIRVLKKRTIGRSFHAKMCLEIIDFAPNRGGSSAADVSKHLRTVQKMKNELPPAAKLAITDHMIHYLVITSLKPHSDLAGLHTLLLGKFSDNPQEITLSYIENQVKLSLPVDVNLMTSRKS